MEEFVWSCFDCHEVCVSGMLLLYYGSLLVCMYSDVVGVVSGRCSRNDTTGVVVVV